MHVWSLDPDDLPEDRKRNLRNATRAAPTAKEAKGAAAPPAAESGVNRLGGNVANSGAAAGSKVWVPLKTFTLSRPDGSGALLGLRLHVDGSLSDDGTQASYALCCTSVEGEFCVGYWGPKDDKPSGAPSSYDDSGAKKEAKVVRQLAIAHAGPSWGLHKHPQLPDYFMTAGDWGFKIWRVGLPAPIVSSPTGEQQIMCARWSPTRAAVVFTGTRDGYVQVWDLLDRTHEPVLSHAVIQEAITCMEFRPVDKRSARGPQFIALGTKQGSFHRFELPHVLAVGQSTELRQTKVFFERERRRVEYFSWRWKERQKEMDKLLQERTAAAAGGSVTTGKSKAEDDAAADKDDESEYVMPPDADRDFLALVDQLGEAAASSEDVPT